MKEWQCTEIGSDSDSSQSPESSPPTSPRGPITLEATTTNSMEDLLQGYSEESECSKLLLKMFLFFFQYYRVNSFIHFVMN